MRENAGASSPIKLARSLAGWCKGPQAHRSDNYNLMSYLVSANSVRPGTNPVLGPVHLSPSLYYDANGIVVTIPLLEEKN